MNDKLTITATKFNETDGTASFRIEAKETWLCIKLTPTECRWVANYFKKAALELTEKMMIENEPKSSCCSVHAGSTQECERGR